VTSSSIWPGDYIGFCFWNWENGEAVNTMRRPNLGFMPYTSVYEAGFFRGTALSYSLSKCNVSFHGLYPGRDGALQQDTISSTEYLSSISYTGLHRTANELATEMQLQNPTSLLFFNSKKNHWMPE